MPIRGYVCNNCKKEFETLYTSFEKEKLEEPEEQCPHCGSKDKERALPSKTNFQLKGRGWYRDKYRK